MRVLTQAQGCWKGSQTALHSNQAYIRAEALATRTPTEGHLTAQRKAMRATTLAIRASVVYRAPPCWAHAQGRFLMLFTVGRGGDTQWCVAEACTWRRAGGGCCL